MNKQAVARRRASISELVLASVFEREPDPDKGLGDWEAFAPSSEDWSFDVYRRIIDLHGERQDTPVAGKWSVCGASCRRLSTVVVSDATTSVEPRGPRVEEQFVRLADRWHDETDFLSSPGRVTGHDAYLRVLALGRRVIPLILEDLRERGGNWYLALRTLSGEDPVPAEGRGDVERMKEHWFQWGRERGHIV